MSRKALLPWLSFALFGAWSAALQGWLASGAAGAWTPDLVLVLLFAVAPRLDGDGARSAALVCALSRCAFSIDPPAAILAATFGAVGVWLALRSTLHLESAGVRAVGAGLVAAATGAWLAIVRLARDPVLGRVVEAAPEHAAAAADPLGAWRCALPTALASLVLTPFLLRLPGFGTLVGRRR